MSDTSGCVVGTVHFAHEPRIECFLIAILRRVLTMITTAILEYTTSTRRRDMIHLGFDKSPNNIKFEPRRHMPLWFLNLYIRFSSNRDNIP